MDATVPALCERILGRKPYKAEMDKIMPKVSRPTLPAQTEDQITPPAQMKTAVTNIQKKNAQNNKGTTRVNEASDAGIGPEPHAPKSHGKVVVSAAPHEERTKTDKKAKKSARGNLCGGNTEHAYSLPIFYTDIDPNEKDDEKPAKKPKLGKNKDDTGPAPASSGTMDTAVAAHVLLVLHQRASNNENMPT